MIRSSTDREQVGIIVAHPDDETLWAGGTILLYPAWRCTVITLCRRSDGDRAPRFARALDCLGATGAMGDLDDGPEQRPLPGKEIQHSILELLGATEFDRILTHSPHGEYTTHRRHEEVAHAVAALWLSGQLLAPALWCFAYSDNHRATYPRAIDEASYTVPLPPSIYAAKSHIIRDIYGFAQESWEARTTPDPEAFWCFDSPGHYREWLRQSEDTL